MFGLSKSIIKTVAAVGALVVIGAAALISLNGNKNSGNNSIQKTKTEIQRESNNENSSNSSNLSGEEQSLNNDTSSNQNNSQSSTPIDAYYRAIVSIFETSEFEANAQVSSKGIVDSSFTSHEILFYDSKTDKCYILGRSLTYNSTGKVTVRHSGGAFLGTKDYEATGELIELYGNLITEKDKIPQYNNLPIRIDSKESIVFTMPPTKSQNWVITLIGTDISYGPPLVFPPESLYYFELALIPGSKNIDISRTYSSSDTVLDEITGNLVKPHGKFHIELKKLSDIEAMDEIAQFNTKLLEINKKELSSDFIPDPDSQLTENKDISADNVHGLPLPKDYPQDVFPIPDSAFVAISNTVPNENNKNGYEVTIKIKESKEDALKNYKSLLKDASIFTMNGISTIEGEKNGYEYSVMIMDNSLGGSQKTMIQIVINPIED